MDSEPKVLRENLTITNDEPPKTKNFKDLTGRRYGRIVVEKYLGRHCLSSVWLCKCDCGNYVRMLGSELCQIKKQMQSYSRFPKTCTRDCRLRKETYELRGRVRGGSSVMQRWRRYGEDGLGGGWENLPTFARFAMTLKPGQRMKRIDESKPWSPSNYTLAPKGRIVSVAGMEKTLTEWGEWFGFSRARAHQLCKEGTLKQRVLDRLAKEQMRDEFKEFLNQKGVEP